MHFFLGLNRYFHLVGQREIDLRKLHIAIDLLTVDNVLQQE